MGSVHFFLLFFLSLSLFFVVIVIIISVRVAVAVVGFEKSLKQRNANIKE